jgi:CBS-domain-containing membrane protein
MASVRDCMTREVETVPAEMDVVEGIGRCCEAADRRSPVVEGGRLAGVISRRDVLRAVLELAR